MKLSEMLSEIKASIEYAESGGPSEVTLEALMTWAKQANETLISIDALYGEKLAFTVEREISLLIDTEVQ